MISVTCPNLNTVGNKNDTLDNAESITCTGDYVTTQADIKNGEVTNTATATVGGQTSNQATITIKAQLAPVLTLTVSASPSLSSIATIYTATDTMIPIITETQAAENPTSTPVLESPTPSLTATGNPPPTDLSFLTPSPGGIVQTILDTDTQLRTALESNISYIVPDSMKLGERVKIILVLNPSSSPQALITEVVEGSGYPTSTAVSGTLVSDQGSTLNVETQTIDVSQLMQAVLVPGEPDDFVIVAIPTDPIQAISSEKSTTWIWNVTAKKSGDKTLTLVISQLVKVEGKDEWRLLKSFEKHIPVSVTPSQRLASLDWKWILGILVTALFIPLFFRWYDARKKVETPTPPK